MDYSNDKLLVYCREVIGIQFAIIEFVVPAGSLRSENSMMLIP
jgi:hypothetical protein